MGHGALERNTIRHGALEHSTMGRGALEHSTIWDGSQVFFAWCSGVWGLAYREKAY